MTNTASDRFQISLRDRWTGFGLMLLPFLVFLLSRPYIGIMHDARLYVGFALAQLDPNGIGQDLLFTADGQSGYSIYPPLLRALVGSIGPSKAAMASAFAGLCFWYAAFFGFARGWLNYGITQPRFAAAILLAVAVSPFYGGTGVFKFAEPYATPRVFAESFVLIALTLLLSGRSLLQVSGPLLLAAATHPIMAAPAIAIAIWWVAPNSRTKLLLVALALAGMLLMIFGGNWIGVDRVPFAQFDAEWRRALDDKESLVFLRWWHPQDFTRTLVQFITVGLAATVINAERRRMVVACVVVAGAGLAITAIGADAVGNILLTQAQLWRALWVVALLATISVPALVVEAWPDGFRDSPAKVVPLKRASVLLLMLAWVVIEYSVNAGTLAVVAAVLWFMPSLKPGISLPRNGVSLIALVVTGLAVFMVGTQAWVTSEILLGSPTPSALVNWNYVWMTAVPGWLIFCVALIALVHGDFKIQPRLMNISVGVALLLIFTAWDSRTAYQVQLERALDKRIAILKKQSVLSPATPVLWPFTDLEAWAFLGRPAWGTPLQGIPAVFSRDLALVWTSRWNRLKAEGLTPAGENAQRTILNAGSWGAEASIERLCAGRDAPALAVLPEDFPVQFKNARMNFEEPKLLQPLRPGDNWKQVDGWKVMACVDVGMAQ